MAQPDQPAPLTAFANHQQSIKGLLVVFRQRPSQGFVNQAGSAGERFTAKALNNVERWQDDALLSQHLNKIPGEDDSAISLLGQFCKLIDSKAVVRC